MPGGSVVASLARSLDSSSIQLWKQMEGTQKQLALALVALALTSLLQRLFSPESFEHCHSIISMETAHHDVEPYQLGITRIEAPPEIELLEPLWTQGWAIAAEYFASNAADERAVAPRRLLPRLARKMTDPLGATQQPVQSQSVTAQRVRSPT